MSDGPEVAVELPNTERKASEAGHVVITTDSDIPKLESAESVLSGTTEIKQVIPELRQSIVSRQNSSANLDSGVATVTVVASNPVVSPSSPSEPPKLEALKSTPPDDLQVSLKQVDKIISGIKDLLDGRRLNASLLVRVVANCMLMADKIVAKNNIKKKIVVASIERFIKLEAGLTQEEQDALMTLVDVVVNDAIDTMIDFRKGNIKLAKKGCCCIC
jgi:hypothetical protein